MDADGPDPGTAPTDETRTDRRETVDPETLLGDGDLDAEGTVLTERQAEVLVLRERGLTQAAIAERLGTTRENVSGLESRARDNVEKARNTVAFAELLLAPIQVELPAGTDLYEAPDRVFEACDDAEIKVTENAPELMKSISDAAGSAIEGRQVKTSVLVSVTSTGRVRVRTA